MKIKKRARMTARLVVSFLILPLAIVAVTAFAAATAASTSDDSFRRVLLVKDSKYAASIEEASQLSLDLPQQPHQSNSNSSSADINSHSSSLASLTLSQRSIEANSNTNGSRTNNKNDQNFSWTETIKLPKIKPSWLNVSSRYKITGASIEEVAYMMPAEYLLRQAFDAPILLKTKLGLIEGVRSIKFNKHLYTFLGIPYAKPPVDDLRFKAPQIIEKWDGIMQATKWPPFCVQPSMTLASKSSPVHPLSQSMSEDCLYLNIWTPSLKLSAPNGRAQKRRPVMVWIHGGAFQYGGISVDENDASALALAGDVVVVAMNYRISAFGFLNANNKENGPNNVGLLDQRMAMEWVQQNIKQFGGDPQQVTLFGESAGGHSVGLHMISPGSQPLFRRAIMQSGVPISFLRSYDVNSDNKGSPTSESISSVMMAKRLKCYTTPPTNEYSFNETSNTATTTTKQPAPLVEDSANGTSSNNVTIEELADIDYEDIPILTDETLACMRNKTSLDILKALGAPGNAGFFPTGNDGKGFFPNGNIMDSFDPENLKIGTQKDYLIGTNTDEGTFMLHYGMPGLFPGKSAPRVDNVEELKIALQNEIDKMAREAASLNSKINGNNTKLTEIQSASGTQTGGAQAHLYRPLLKTSTSVLENFMPKSRYQVLENGTVIGNASANWSKEAEFGKNIGSLITDIIFLCPARSLARTLSEAGRNVYFYLYSHRSSLSQYHDWLGCTHHDEVEFVFGRPLRLADMYTGKDIEMSQRLIKIWSHFAHTGQTPEQFGTPWPKYHLEDNNYMLLTPNEANVGQRYHDRVCNVYDNVISVHLQDA